MSLRVWMPWVRTWLCSPSMGAEAARGVEVEGEKPLIGGATSWMLLIEFFSSVSDFSAVWSLAQMRSQSCCCQLKELARSLPQIQAHLSRQGDGAAVDVHQAVHIEVVAVLAKAHTDALRRRMRLARWVVGA